MLKFVLFGFCVLSISTKSFAHDARKPPATDLAPDEGGPNLPEADHGPRLKTYVQPAYPEEARRQGLGGTVTLRLHIDAAGRVTGAAVERGLGPAIDEAARAAALRLEFDPARSGGRAVPRSVLFEYRFTPPGHTHAEAAAPVAPVAAPPPATHAPSLLVDDRVEEITVVDPGEAERPPAAASARSVGARELALRPVQRPSDLFRVAPGLMVVQHAGGGKAPQYLLRGFDADHGTDVALSLDGVPLNMVSHGHGQGFADANWIIPELVERVEVAKGPYAASGGDFATAGSIDLVTRDHGESLLSVGGGSFGTVRAVAIASPHLSSPAGKSWFPLVAAEVVRTDGPFEHPERFAKYNLFGKLTHDLDARSSIALAVTAYGGNWNASGQLPARAVRAGLVGFYGALDPGEGGASSRDGAHLVYRLRPDKASELTALAYLASCDFALYSNFTLFSRDAVQGDQIEQWDGRTIGGARLEYRWLRQWRGMRLDSALGGSARADAIASGLAHTRARERVAKVVDAEIRQSSVGLHASEAVQFARWLRLQAGLRLDHFNFRVQDRLAPPTAAGADTSGVRGQSRLGPKASLVLSPHPTTDVFANLGYGFHSNDARGVVRQIDPVTPTTRTIGYELGARTHLWHRRLDLALALWGIDVASEVVWLGDEGTTEAAGATRRLGVEADLRVEILPWLLADAEVTLSDAKFREDAGRLGQGRAVPLAPRLTASGGISALHRSGARGGLRALYVGRRPATEDAFLQAEATLLVDLFAAWRWRALELALTIENLLDRRTRAAQVATISRLPGEPPTDAPPAPGACPGGTRVATDPATGNFQGCEDLSFTAGSPLSASLMATYYF